MTKRKAPVRSSARARTSSALELAAADLIARRDAGEDIPQEKLAAAQRLLGEQKRRAA